MSLNETPEKTDYRRDADNAEKTTNLVISAEARHGQEQQRKTQSIREQGWAFLPAPLPILGQRYSVEAEAAGASVAGGRAIANGDAPCALSERLNSGSSLS